MQASQRLRELAEIYRSKEIEFPHLKPVTLASWILESGWGNSCLAALHNNFAGMKYREAMSGLAQKVKYEAHDGVDFYCSFSSLEDFIDGYWAFLQRSPYNGWRSRADGHESFIEFVGPIWATDPAYSEKVLDLLGNAELMLGGHQHAEGSVCDACGDGAAEVGEKPRVDRWEPTSHQSSRNGADIDHIVIHYTTSRNIEGTISHFKHGSPRTSAHYIVGQKGALVQMVNDSERAWHAGSSEMNARSIGIEHVAAPGDRITEDQGRTSAALIRWLMREYDIPQEQVIPHVCVKNTLCCGDLFAEYGGGSGKGCSAQSKALHKWMTAAVV